MVPIPNRLVPILVGIVVLLVVLVAFRSCGPEEKPTAMLRQVPIAPRPDADSPADTIKTLTANVAGMTQELGALRRDNATLRKENEALLKNRDAIEERVAATLREELRAEAQTRAQESPIEPGALTALGARIDDLAASLATIKTHGSSDLPIGLGFEGAGALPDRSNELVWIAPLDRASRPTPAGDGLLDRPGRPPQGARDAATAYAASGSREPLGEARHAALSLRPIYTVPRNATLIGATAMTALLGRIPINGQVRDPMPFKVITGADNLAASGLTIPGVHGMIWSGTAIGDWTLGCVSGHLESVTFVFDDGTIRTISSDERANGQGESGKRAMALGWISDAQGIPCVSGDRKTNAAAFLSQRIGVQAIEAAAEAAAAGQTTRTVGSLGTVTDSVTGNPGAYVLGKTVAGGSSEIAKWLIERQAQSFDAVFVPAGVALAIHVDRELPIDFDPNGRKLNHEIPNTLDRHDPLD